MGEDEWVKVAMTDVSMVAELLMHLNRSKAHALLPAKRIAPVVPLQWGVRLPRSRQILRCNMVQVKKEGGSTRASPTTPLSWSGGTSFSAGAGDGYEESSRPANRLSTDRSKTKKPLANEVERIGFPDHFLQGSSHGKYCQSSGYSGHFSEQRGLRYRPSATVSFLVYCVTAACETTIRRSRKKKTFAELKEEESLLMNERIYLKKELMTLRITLEEQRARNKSLKRMKLDLHPQSATKADTASFALEKVISDQFHHNKAATVDHTPTILPTSVTCDELLSPSPPLESQIQRKDVVSWESSFVLPDLNLPIEEESGSEVLYGMS
ncbi:hypothetical protein HHK36_006328 [Tetracentron sinense]|uniref:Uncharacterized protein n=1 Tax=Tetracentron sinense TaxID=13715 RepID=A0A834ZHV2_TETSI|nr:hypothetical protein HHK36_006328 [Tetracentron sinense]